MKNLKKPLITPAVELEPVADYGVSLLSSDEFLSF
jgi:hypothetical protein